MFSDLHEDCAWYKERAHQLEMAIKRHFDQTIGQNACWENDEELWKILDDGINRTYPHSETPSMEEMMLECVKYCASRQCNQDAVVYETGQFEFVTSRYPARKINEHLIDYLTRTKSSWEWLEINGRKEEKKVAKEELARLKRLQIRLKDIEE